MLRVLFFLLISILISSCDTESKRKHQLMHDAEDLETALLANYHKLEANLEKAPIENSSLNNRLKALKANMDLIKSDHHHDHSGEGHHQCNHDHGSSTINLTSEDKIIVLNEFSDSLNSISADLERLIKQ